MPDVPHLGSVSAQPAAEDRSAGNKQGLKRMGVFVRAGSRLAHLVLELNLHAHQVRAGCGHVGGSGSQCAMHNGAAATEAETVASTALCSQLLSDSWGKIVRCLSRSLKNTQESHDHKMVVLQNVTQSNSSTVRQLEVQIAGTSSCAHRPHSCYHAGSYTQPLHSKCCRYVVSPPCADSRT